MLKRYFITGLLVWIPLVITIWVLSMIVSTLDYSIILLPPALRPENLLGFDIPGAGAAVTLLLIFITGVLATNFLGQRLVIWWERMVARIPVVNSIYNTIKQLSDTLLGPGGNAFRTPLLIEYPRKGIWTLAFLTGKPGGDLINHLGEDCVNVYIPTTPVPTSGFFLMMPAKDVVELDMSVDEALKYIISGGVVSSPSKLRSEEEAEPNNL